MSDLEKRRAAFGQFYQEMMPVLVDFVGKIGINPAHEVLNHAVEFTRYVVGRFDGFKDAVIDPFEIAREYVDSPVPRRFQDKLVLTTKPA